MIHQAGPLVAGVQMCSRCNTVLLSYRDAMVQSTEKPSDGWPMGASVEVIEGRPKGYVLSDAAPNCPEQTR
jgi:hypothetical protein